MIILFPDLRPLLLIYPVLIFGVRQTRLFFCEFFGKEFDFTFY